MNIFEEFRKLESGDFGFFVFSVCGTVCPGILAIWLFDPELIVASTTPKLVVLAISFMLPYIALNSWIIGMTTGAAAGTPKQKTYIQLFLQSGVTSLFLFSICLAVRFFFGVSLNAFLIILAILEIFFVFVQRNRSAKNQEPPHDGQTEQEQSPKHGEIE